MCYTTSLNLGQRTTACLGCKTDTHILAAGATEPRDSILHSRATLWRMRASKIHPGDWDRLFAPNGPRRGGPLRALVNVLLTIVTITLLGAGGAFAIKYRNDQNAARIATVTAVAPTLVAIQTQTAEAITNATATRVASRDCDGGGRAADARAIARRWHGRERRQSAPGAAQRRGDRPDLAGRPDHLPARAAGRRADMVPHPPRSASGQPCLAKASLPARWAGPPRPCSRRRHQRRRA